MREQALCDLIGLRATSAKSITLNDESATRELFVVRKDDGLFAYENACFHIAALRLSARPVLGR